jgi:plastocyanin
MKKIVIILAVVALVLVGGFYAYKYITKAPVVTPPTTDNGQPKTEEPVDINKTIEGYVPKTVTVTYTDEGYSPKEIQIFSSDTVEFKNESSKKMWPASDYHPYHSNYPESGGCVDSKFDACIGIEPGASWSFTFMAVGFWGYHDELSDTEKTGVIEVEEPGWLPRKEFVMPTEFTPIDQEYGGVLVTFDGFQFKPDPIKIKKGTTVIWKNNSKDGMWPASDPHPVHTDYPTTGGCIGSTFDPCTEIAPGGTWSFVFDEVGTWGYHDHVKVRVFGTVVVE